MNSRRLPLLLCLAVAAATVLVLRLEGRAWWCACGGWSPWAWNVWSSHNSQHVLDPYSVTHFLHGFVFSGFLRWLFPTMPRPWRLVGVVVLEAAWEVLENSPFALDRYRATAAAFNYFGDSVANSISDLLLCALGAAAAQRWGVRLSLYVFVALEIVLLVWIRDNLTLNVLMLLFPIDAVKGWRTP
jgi:hypothetical protein